MQQADKRIHWHPWKEETFIKAKQENKPIYLFITYPTCQYCIKMEQENFSDPEIIDIINTRYIPIYVDKNLRPDVDMLYMEYASILLGSAGWPLNLVLDTNQFPFFIGSYLPKDANKQFIGFAQLLTSLSNTYMNDYEGIKKASISVEKTMQKFKESSASNNFLDEETIANTYYQLQKNYDSKNGGLQETPKFILPQNLDFLLDYAKLMKSKGAEKMVNKTLHQIYKGGIYDHIDFGFYRYSNDLSWYFPHFEKMLADNAQLIQLYARMYAYTKDSFYKRISYQVVSFVEERLKSDLGGYFTALSGDLSLSTNQSNLFSKHMLKSALTQQEQDILEKQFGLDYSATYEDQYILNLIHLSDYDLTESLEEVIAPIREKLKYFNSHTKKTNVDKSILTSTNALLATSYSIAGKIFEDSSLIQKARDILAFLDQHHTNKETLFRTNKQLAFLDDYANIISAKLEVFLSSSQVKYLHDAILLNRQMHELFFDTKLKEYRFTQETDIQLTLPKEMYDASTPSAQSVIAHNRFLLHSILDECDDTFKAKKQINRFKEQMITSPLASVHMTHAFLKQKTHRIKIVIVYESKTKVIEEIIRQMQLLDSPFVTFLALTKDEARKSPYFEEYVLDEPFFFTYCENGACDEPLLNEHDAIEYLDLFVLK